ncbi:hypothetical protein RIF29_37707 [Crotalaria pallida]|uniref:Uncharacterized protein n=1 Tax=Crotalaria pallida TaxID=3830 RepID=A0AAN9HUZ4_CROPI
MRKEANKQSKFKHCILTLIRILKGVPGCAGGFVGCGVGAGAGAIQISHYPETKSINLNTSRENNGDHGGQVELMRTLPIITVGNETRRNYCLIRDHVVLANNSTTSKSYGQVHCCYCPEPHGLRPCNNYAAGILGERAMSIRNNVGSQTRVVVHGEKMVTLRNNGGNETRAIMHRQRQQINYARYKYNRKKMSYYSDGVRKMGRIDEDKPCSFEEDQNNSNKAHHLLYLYPRTRTYVATKRAVCNQ